MTPSMAKTLHDGFLAFLAKVAPRHPAPVDPVWDQQVRALLRSKKWQDTGKLPSGFGRQIGAHDREQEILTPVPISRFVLDLFDGQVELDPCGIGDNHPRYFDMTYEPVNVLTGPPNGLDGLKERWQDRTYANPPYKDLKTWLYKALYEAYNVPFPRIAMLCPVRPHRVWYRTVAETTSCVVSLNPVTFVGFKGAFPSPLALFVWNIPVESVAAALALQPKSIGAITFIGGHK